MNTMEVPVLIAGGGPAGLTMSLLLSRHGVASLLRKARRLFTAAPGAGHPRASHGDPADRRSRG